ncbi:hypothetical protein IV203_011979 [Nitzschia inconspicua]|uniref:Uncharacterized protein n=1 Tax=Nitzschia inconspicua TaxID=303405 RepID=A0A9K3KTC0_9STRA|nr:hypothetical protein IV203_011979 [Nitzschia inconspicua]
MMKVVQFLLLSIGFLPSILGQSTLVPKISTAQCSGQLSDLVVTSATCQYAEYGCTYGSEVFVTGQVKANSDIPRPMRVHMANTFPGWYKAGFNAYNSQISDVCSSGAMSPPENEDSAYSCPSPGVYNFHFSFKNPGNRRSIFSDWNGFSYGVVVHFKHDTEGGDWATCHMNVKVKKSDYGNVTNYQFLSVAGIGIAFVAIGLFYRRRRERVAGEEEACHDSGETVDMATNFELVQEHVAV